jgi:solute carrier family 25 phosphate transporter 23/24/25/41
MGVEEAGRAAATGKKLALASIRFADVRVGAGYKDDLLVVGLPVPKDDGLDVVGDLAVRLPDVGAAVRVSNCRSQCLPAVVMFCFCMPDDMSVEW